MQTTRIPAGTCARIQSIIKQFVWGTTDHRKGVPLVKWDEMCQPKHHGGCGLKNINGQNSAFLMKLAYGMHTRADALWVQVLRSKYGWQNDGPQHFHTRNTSYLWKSLLTVWSDLNLGLTWKVGNGRKARFWTDNWIGDLGALSRLSYCPINDVDLQKTVSGYTTQDGQWRWNEFQSQLPHDSLTHFTKINPPQRQDHEDYLCWRGSNKFTVRSAYDLIMQDHWDDENELWSLAWNWAGPQRVKTFLWMALKGRLLTNSERARRHMADAGNCTICGSATEDVEHVIRHCLLARDCWPLIVPAQHLPLFNSAPFTEWMHMNLEKGDSTWCLTFGIICWRLWRARNTLLFTNQETTAASLVNEALAFTEHTRQALDFCAFLPPD